MARSKKEQQDYVRNTRLYNTYGITLEEYKSMYAVRGGCCDFCGRYYKVLNVDHRHIKGFKKLKPELKRLECRGLLCLRCNKFTLGGLEIHKNAREILDKLIAYSLVYKLKGDV